MTIKTIDCRAAAARCLAAVSNGSSLSQQIPIFELQVIEKDRALFRQLCYGVLRFYPKLAGISQQLISKPLKNKHRDIQMLVMLGLYQLSEMRIPDHAAVSTTVIATKVLKKHWAGALVNGVLRQWQRNPQALVEKLSPAEQHSHPEWFHKLLNQVWPEQASAIEQANNTHPPMCLRVNQQHATAAEYLQQLQDQTIEARQCDYAQGGIRLAEPVAVDQLPGFSEGKVSVQDEAAQLSAELLALAPQQRVLDACCAPGGKTCHILEVEPQLTEVIGLDIDQQRLNRVQENLQRLKLKAQLIAGDAADIDAWWDGKPFDRILLDAPCSATGVIRRNPDIKLHRTLDDIQQLHQLQFSILQALWQTLAPGGLLLYATCSVLPDENEHVVARFCGQQEDAEHQAISADWGLSRPYGRQLFPTESGHDGFFYALIAKKA